MRGDCIGDICGDIPGELCGDACMPYWICPGLPCCWWPEPLPPPPGSTHVSPQELRDREWSTEGQCQGETRLGERCKVHKKSKHADAAPLRRGELFCRHHDPKKYTGVQCKGMRKNGKGRCRVWSGSSYADAAPLRRGSLFCHHHRVRCAGHSRFSARCCVTSSCEHVHAEPLRRGEVYCAHHCLQDATAESDSDAGSDTLSTRDVTEVGRSGSK